MKYVYFVSFFYLNKDKEMLFGNLEITSNRQLSSIEDIRFMENDIMRDDKSIKGLNVSNFILLRTEDE